MWRVSITTLEKFRRVMAEASPYDTEEALLQSLRGEFIGNCKTVTGTAWHKIIEAPLAKDVQYCIGSKHEYIVADGIGFPITEALKAKQFHDDHPTMVYEIPLKPKVYSTHHGQIAVTGRIDGLEGMIVHDHKTKFRYMTDIEEYTDSCQWKFYLDNLSLKEMHYNVFEIRRFKEFELEDAKPILLDVLVVQHPPIICYAYNGMGAYCEKLVGEFMDYISFRNLYHLLKEIDPTTYEPIAKAVPATV